MCWEISRNASRQNSFSSCQVIPPKPSPLSPPALLLPPQLVEKNTKKKRAWGEGLSRGQRLFKKGGGPSPLSPPRTLPGSVLLLVFTQLGRSRPMSRQPRSPYPDQQTSPRRLNRRQETGCEFSRLFCPMDTYCTRSYFPATLILWWKTA